MKLKCLSCSFETKRLDLNRCANCGGFLILEYEVLKEFKRDKNEPGIWAYKSLLPNLSARISLGEGNTPLIKASNLSRKLELEILLKKESLNPTGSFMDRGSAVYVSYLKDAGISKIRFFTTGNFGCSLAAYAAHAKIYCEAYVDERINQFKLLQMIWLGAKVNIGEPHAKLKMLTQADPLFIEGLKTQMFEIFEQLGLSLPNYIVVPVASGSNIFSFYKAYEELKRLGLIGFKTFKFIGARPDKEAMRTFADLDSSFLYCKEFLERIRKADLLMEEFVSKDEIIEAMSMFAKEEGILVEPASSVTLAALNKLYRKGLLESNSKIVLVVTGSGLKEIGNISLIKTERFGSKKQTIGYTKLRILELLSEKPMHGYSIWKRLKQEGINIALPTLYEHLKELEELNMITTSQALHRNRRLRISLLTEYGRKYLELRKSFEQRVQRN